MSNIIIFDFEVFKYDTLLGALIIDENNNKTVFQTWDLEEIKAFYFTFMNDMWIGHNNINYDNLILEAIVNGKDPYKVSKSIINAQFRPRCGLLFHYFDLMGPGAVGGPYSLKMTELIYGKKISETEVSFDLDRHLTDEEKSLTESYNRDDLDQTYTNFTYEFYDKFTLRLMIAKEWNLNIDSVLNCTGTKLGAIVLGAHHIDGIENMYIKPKLYSNLELKNQQLLDFYLNEDFRANKKLKINICGVEHTIGQGGIHAAKEKYHTSKALYFDVSGYYNLTMINFDLLPRTLGERGKQMYIDMYHEQLEMKKTGDVRRSSYKTILLSVFGAMGNKYTDFYDPQKLLLVTMTGQLFIVDLLEHLEKYVSVIQSNTDGIIVEPFDWKDEQTVIDIVDQWCKRTGYVIQPKKIYDIWQRDVNCYCYRDEKQNIHVVGEAVNKYERYKYPVWHRGWDSKEPFIFAFCIVEYLMNNKSVEETIEKYKRNLKFFQFVCKKSSFDWTELQENYNDGTVGIIKLQGVNRAFASNDTSKRCEAYKCRSEGKTKRVRIPNLPDNVFVYDDEIMSDSAIDYLSTKIDWQYYIDRAKEKIKTFFNIPVIKKLSITSEEHRLQFKEVNL